MLDLMKVLTEEDNKLIRTYLINYSQAGIAYCGNEIFLREWAKNKKKLYGLLGNSLKYEEEFAYEASTEELSKKLQKLVNEDKTIYTLTKIFSRRNEYGKIIENLLDTSVGDDIFTVIDTLAHLQVCLKVDKPVKNGGKFKIKNHKKFLQVSKNASAMKSLIKFVTYFYDNIKEIREDYPDLLKDLEEFRLKHSLILNDKIVKGKIVISIHPLDFLTMSNNSLKWTSCMKWGYNQKANNTKSGCYHTGTIEMMNSNNVVCCYLEAQEPYKFHKSSITEEEYCWNNKKWRNLFIVTPDIICSNKQYPYVNNSLNNKALELIKDLAFKNKGWKYKYGPQLYNDMININDNYNLDYFLNVLKDRNNCRKIVFDTTGMYNDFINNSGYEFWCYRNPVKNAKMIRYSGKALCTGCGAHFIRHNYFDEWGEYNERYGSDPERDVCEECLYKVRECRDCNRIENGELQTLAYKSKIICKNCFLENYYYCEDCGALLPRHYFSLNQIYINIDNYDSSSLEKNGDINTLETYTVEDSILIRDKKKGKYVKLGYVCDCKRKDFLVFASTLPYNEFIKHKNTASKIYIINSTKYSLETLNKFCMKKTNEELFEILSNHYNVTE